MIARITPRALRGTVGAIPSKSEAHRVLICAAFADRDTFIALKSTNADIEATLRVLEGFGVRFGRTPDGVSVMPVLKARPSAVVDCGESGSTLRFLLPVAGALGADVTFLMRGKLAERPVSPLDEQLIIGGCTITRPAPDSIRIQGKLRSGYYTLPGSVSSQFITGMLFALSLLDGKSALTVTGRTESADYMAMTLDAMRAFGVHPEKTPTGYAVNGQGYVSPGRVTIGGDWSNAAFWLCAGAIPGCDITVTGLDPLSSQGDRRVTDEIKRIKRGDCEIDASDIPDLVPALSAFACCIEASVRFVNAGRLRLKESDRLSAVTQVLSSLGAAIEETEDGLFIRGGCRLTGGEVDSFNDHRIAMMAAIASICCKKQVIVRDAQAVNKSYPSFWRDFGSLGGLAELTGE